MEKNKIQRSIILPKEDLEKLNALASKKYISVNDIIRQAISEFIKKSEDANK